MSLLFRKINQAKFVARPDLSWLNKADSQADALGELKTTMNRLSCYRIDAGTTRLRRLEAAFAGNMKSVGKLDYALFDEDLLRGMRIRTEEVGGDLKDAVANRWHVHLIELTARKIMLLADCIRVRATIKRVYPDEVLENLEWALGQGYILGEDLSEGIRKRLSG